MLPALDYSTCPARKIFPKPYNKSFIGQACSVEMAGYWPCSFLGLWTSTLSQSINTQKKLGQYPAILTSHLVNNPYIPHIERRHMHHNCHVSVPRKWKVGHVCGLCPKSILRDLNSSVMQKRSLVSLNKYGRWSCECIHSIEITTQKCEKLEYIKTDMPELFSTHVAEFWYRKRCWPV